LNELICNITTTHDQNIPASADFKIASGAKPLGPAIGTSLTGVAFLSGMDANNVDPAYPVAYGGLTLDQIGRPRSNFDECLGHSTPLPSNVYHYHLLPPCVANPLL
jgi:hypothetical protein